MQEEEGESAALLRADRVSLKKITSRMGVPATLGRGLQRRLALGDLAAPWSLWRFFTERARFVPPALTTISPSMLQLLPLSRRRCRRLRRRGRFIGAELQVVAFTTLKNCGASFTWDKKSGVCRKGVPPQTAQAHNMPQFFTMIGSAVLIGAYLSRFKYIFGSHGLNISRSLPGDIKFYS